MLKNVRVESFFLRYLQESLFEINKISNKKCRRVFMVKNGFFTSESVTEGHPDKICDQISDGVLDAVLSLDPNGRVACETLAGNGFIVITGEVSLQKGKKIDYDWIARNIIHNIGYTKEFGLDPQCDIIVKMNQQSPDIAQGVDVNGAGDQGMVFGFAINETKTKMPLPISLAHQLTQRLAKVRKEGVLDFLGPDGKAQVTLKYHQGKVQCVDTIVLSSQHKDSVDQEYVASKLKQHVILPVIPESLLTEKTKFYINPTGKFVIGGPQADTGLTGRKIIVDTYGGFARHGGGAFSGKDPTKVDRSGAYIARYIAKNIVAAGLADICEVQLAYAIGVSQPLAVYVDTFNTGKVCEEMLAQKIPQILDLSPLGIIEYLSLKKAVFFKTATYGHFGREEEAFTWEKKDLVEQLKQHFL